MKSLINLTKQAIELYLTRQEILSLPDDLPDHVKTRRAGVFVTLKRAGELRGCVGTYLPTKNCIAEEVIYNAISAATCDDRFSSVTHEEVEQLTYEVSILGEPESVKGLHELNPKEYGVIVKTLDGRCGLLLPDIEGISTVEKQVFIACQKGGINPKEEQIAIFRFAVEKITE